MVPLPACSLPMANSRVRLSSSMWPARIMRKAVDRRLDRYVSSYRDLGKLHWALSICTVGGIGKRGGPDDGLRATSLLGRSLAGLKCVELPKK